MPHIHERRKISSKKAADLTNGPGKVGQALGIDKAAMNGIDLTVGKGCWLEDDPAFKCEVETSPRVNIDYAEEWIDKPWRYSVKGNKFVSRVPKSTKKTILDEAALQSQAKLKTK